MILGIKSNVNSTYLPKLNESDQRQQSATVSSANPASIKQLKEGGNAQVNFQGVERVKGTFRFFAAEAFDAISSWKNKPMKTKVRIFKDETGKLKKHVYILTDKDIAKHDYSDEWQLDQAFRQEHPKIVNPCGPDEIPDGINTDGRMDTVIRQNGNNFSDELAEYFLNISEWEQVDRADFLANVVEKVIKKQPEFLGKILERTDSQSLLEAIEKTPGLSEKILEKSPIGEKLKQLSSLLQTMPGLSK